VNVILKGKRDKEKEKENEKVKVKVKVKLKFVPVFFLTEHHAMKAFWGVDV
jgi:hypothetical protein